jgi:hypothetical protein
MAPVTARAKQPVSYTALCEREGDWWVITVPELKSGGVTQARTLDEVPATVADLVATMTDVDPGTVKVKVVADTGPGINLGKAGLVALAVAGATAALVREIIRLFTRVPSQ